MSVTGLIDGILKGERNTTRWAPSYVSLIFLASCCMTLLAIILHPHDWQLLLLFALLSIAAELAQVNANQRLDHADLNLLHTLGAVIDAYDLYTFGHSAQVARYAGAIAEAMALPLEEQMAIVRGALIHDIGKVGVTDAIIGKQGRLTAEEYEMMKLHTVIGAEIVSQMPMLQHLVPLVRNHHERWDGRGYPDGLQGDEIALAARIVAVADSVEAMLSDRPYQETRALQDVVAEVIRCAGQQYDPAVVRAFVMVAEVRGNDFFINSAAKIAQELKVGEKLDATTRVRYAKKSMAHIGKAI